MKSCAGEPNYFIDKIWLGLWANKISFPNQYWQYHDSHTDRFGKRWDSKPFADKPGIHPKEHTIRRGHRWKPGMKIHMAINNRSPNRFQFVPVLVCAGVQDIEIIHKPGIATLIIDGAWFDEVLHHGFDDIHQFGSPICKLAAYDGFDSLTGFLEYFNTDFIGQIVHWTTVRY